MSLNPCCNGIYLIITASPGIGGDFDRLNPCCNGIYLIMALIENSDSTIEGVLILVVMEYT